MKQIHSVEKFILFTTHIDNFQDLMITAPELEENLFNFVTHMHIVHFQTSHQGFFSFLLSYIL